MDINPALEKFMHSIPLFELVEREDILELLRLLRQVNLEAGEVLFRQGEVGKCMWVLGAGAQVALSVRMDDLDKPLAGLGPGETVGEMSLIDDAQRSASATVLSSGMAYCIEAMDFDVLRDEFMPAAFRILRKMAADMCQRLRMVSVQIVPDGPGVGEGAAAGRPPAGDRIKSSTLEEFAPFKGAPATARLALAQMLTELTLEPGEVVFREGEPSDAAYFLVEGEVETRRQGKVYISLGPGSMFGLVSVIDRGSRSATCVAKSTARVWRLASGDFERLFALGNRFAFKLVDLVARQLAGNLRQANATLVGKGLEPPAVPTGQSLSALDLGVDLAFDEIMG